MQAKRVFEACVCAPDLAAAERFYTRVLGLEVASNFAPRGIAFRCGQGVVLVFDPKHCEKMKNGIPGHGTIGAGHVAFATDADELPAWCEPPRRLQRADRIRSRMGKRRPLDLLPRPGGQLAGTGPADAVGVCGRSAR